MIWPWLVALLLAWSAVGAVVARAAAYHLLSRMLRRNLARRSQPRPVDWDVVAGDVMAWVECLAGVIVAGVLWPLVLAIWARGRRFEVGRSR
jgi:hypothetical protein